MPGNVEIHDVATKRDLRTFILFPWKIYRGATRYEHWVPPLIMDEKEHFDTEKYPFYRHSELKCFLAVRDGAVVGRISASIDRNFIDYHKEKTGFFGYFESIDDGEVAAKLFDATASWLCGKGMGKMIGPMNPSSNDTLGFLTEGFDGSPFILMPYNPPYYNELCEKSGLAKEKDLYAYFTDTTYQPLSDKMRRIVDLVKKQGKVSWRPVDLKRLKRETEIIREIYNDAWSDNWGFVPWTEEETYHLGKNLKLIAIPDLVPIAYIGDEPVAFLLAIPDINQVLKKINGRLLPFGVFKLLWYKSKIDALRVIALGVKKKYQNMGIDALLVHEVYMDGVQRGFHRGEFSWILEGNMKIRNLLENWGAKHYRSYRIYKRELA